MVLFANAQVKGKSELAIKYSQGFRVRFLGGTLKFPTPIALDFLVCSRDMSDARHLAFERSRQLYQPKTIKIKGFPDFLTFYE